MLHAERMIGRCERSGRGGTRRPRLGAVLAGCVMALGCGLWGPSLTAGPAHGAEPDEERTVGLYQRLAPATVFLSSSYLSAHPLLDPPATGVGAGFILDEAGTVLTNAHVVEGASTVMATLYDGRRVKAELLGSDPYTDVAVLHLTDVPGKLTAVRLGDSDHLRIGQRALVLGSPFGLGFTLTTGIISGLGPVPGAMRLNEFRLIQTTAPINPGNSGGPLVDSEGRVIGITTAILAGAQNIGFAIPINTAKAVLGELKQNGRVVRPWLGVGGKFPTDEMLLLFALPLAKGLLVEDVEEGSPAAETGLRAGALDVVVEGVPWVLGGDILVSLQGQSVHSDQALVEVMKTLHVGQTVQVEFLRDGQRYQRSLTVRTRPNSIKKAVPPRTRSIGMLPRGLRGRDGAGVLSF